MFTLFNIESATLLSERITMDDGRKAARAARLLSLKTKQRFQPRKIESDLDDSTWHKREEERFLSGEYMPLVEQLNQVAGIYEIQNGLRLFAHISKKNPSLIAYTKDAIKGAQDKQSLLSIEAFVKMVCKADETQAYLTLLQTNHVKAHMPQPFKLATTPDEIEKVYTNYAPDMRHVSGSCMRYSHDEIRWPKVDFQPCHPVRVYGAGDLAIAYMTNGEGKTTARALCWPDKKIYSRMYADNDSLHKALQDAGYSKGAYYGCNPSLEGARLSLIESDGGEYIAPYLDEIGRAKIKNGFLVIDSDGDYVLQNTSGTAEEKNGHCDSCGDSFNEDDLSTVYTRSHMNQSESWCEHCRSNSAFYCEGEHEYFSDNVDHTIINDEYYTSRYAENHASYCDYYEEYTFGELTTVIVDSNGDMHRWSENAIESHAFEYNGDYYSKDVDYERVVVERHVLQMRYRFSPIYTAINAWFTDVTRKIPTHLIDDGEVDVVEAANGRFYLKDYVDHYPVARERFDMAPTPLLDSLVTELDSLAA